MLVESEVFEATDLEDSATDLHEWTTPAHATRVRVRLQGEDGEDGDHTPGDGMEVTGTLAVEPEETLYVGTGFGRPTGGGDDGGGSADIRQGGDGVHDRVAVAGAGGAGASSDRGSPNGGDAGFPEGEDGEATRSGDPRGGGQEDPEEYDWSASNEDVWGDYGQGGESESSAGTGGSGYVGGEGGTVNPEFDHTASGGGGSGYLDGLDDADWTQNGAAWGGAEVEIEYFDGEPAADLEIVDVGTDTISLQWTDTNDGAVDYDVYRITDSDVDPYDGDAERVETVDGESYIDTGVSEGTTYYYVVVPAVDTDFEPFLSNEVSTTTELPAPEIEVFDATSNDEIDASWTLASTDEEGVRLEVSLDDGLTWEIAEDLAAGTESVTWSDALDGRVHVGRVVVSTTDVEVTSDPSDPTTTDLPDVDGFVLDASVQDELAVESITPTIDNGEYRIQWRRSIDSTFDNETTIPFDADPLGHIISPVLDGEQYDVRVRSETDDVTGAYHTADEITKLVAADALEFTDVTQTGLTVSWTDNSDFDGSHQILRARTDYEYDDAGELVATLSDTTTDYTTGTLAPGREYEWTVRATTQYVHADASATVTTDSAGFEQQAVPPRGWYAEIDHPNGQTITPQILDDPSRRPTVNGFPRVDLPTTQAEKWHAEAFDDAQLAVWLDGDREPIETLEHRQLEPGRTVLEGRGGTQLDRRVIEDVDIEPVHEVAERLITDYSDYVANVDQPASEGEERTLLAADTSFEIEQDFVTIGETVPLKIDNNTIKPLKTCWVADGRAAATQNATISDDGFEGGTAGLSGSEIDDFEWTISNEYTIPADELVIVVRGRRQFDDSDPVLYDVLVDGEFLVDTTLPSGGTDLEWSTISGDGLAAIEPGTHTIKLDAQFVDGLDPDDNAIDFVAAFDGRFDHTLDNEVHEPNGYLDGPEEYPDLVRLQNTEINTPLAISAVSIDVQTDDGAGVPELGIRQDGTGAYDTVSDTLSHSIEYSELVATAQTRVGLGRKDGLEPRDETPRLGYEPQALDSVEVSAVLDDTPVLTDRSFDGRLIDVLREIADIGNFVFEVRSDGGGTTIEWTQIDQRDSDVDPDLADYGIDRQTEDVVERAIIYGGAQRITRQTVDVAIDEFVDLPFVDSRIVEGKETVYVGDDEFSRGTDYEIRYTTADGIPQLKALADGDLEDGQTVSIDADVKPRGEFVQGGVTEEEDARTIIEDIPGLASKQMCDQVALYLVEETGSALTEVEITVPSESVGWSVIEAIDPDELPGSGPYQTREIQSSAAETTIRLADRQSASEAVQNIRDRTSRNSERV